jgi:phenylpropionate dioxygenase-like ring-hydroxylating dioxygenase large terminal subunit
MPQQSSSPSHGISYQELLDQESVPVPEHLRICNNPKLDSLRLDPSRYTSQAMHDQEAEHVWAKSWQLACRVEDIPNTGDHIVYDVANISLIVVRTEDGSIQAFHNSCLHRGRKLVTEDGCQNTFRCPYHAWTWNLDGSIKFVPCKKDFEHTEDKAFDLPQANVGVWQGFVFINPDVNAKPLDDFLEVLPDHYKDYELDKCAKVIHVQKKIDCNWKVGLEAFMESYHVIATHPQILPFTADANSQYDILSDHISRLITANCMTSPHLQKLPEQEILESMLADGGRMNSETPLEVPEGMSARKFMANLNRETFAAAYDKDFSQVTDSELLDPILYWVFPNIQIWGGFLSNIVYQFRPDGNNPNRCIFDIRLLQRFKDGEEKPTGLKPHVLTDDEAFSDAEELGVLGGVFDQDMNNLPHMQEGLRAASANGRDGLIFGTYQESRIVHMHRMIDRYIQGK